MFRPKKSFGQNFLKNFHVVEKILATAQLTGIEEVVEVGPGFGVLTNELIKCAKHVTAIEKDDFLFEKLKEKYSNIKNLTLIHADVLMIPPPQTSYHLIANIPYSITSPLLDHFIRNNYKNVPAGAVLLVQKEVAEKICAKPPHMNVLALHVQTFCEAKIISTVSRHNFKPVPKVDSAIIHLTPKQTVFTVSSRSESLNYEKYFSLIHQAFAHKRKMLRGVFSESLLSQAGIESTRRAETLSIDEWEKITECSLDHAAYPSQVLES